MFLILLTCLKILYFQVRAMLRPPTQGVVLQAYGSGNIPLGREDILKEIAEAVKRGTLVVIVSQCAKGHISASYEGAKVSVRSCKIRKKWNKNYLKIKWFLIILYFLY